jgi:tetratricopeptide (TPR) repeat protein
MIMFKKNIAIFYLIFYTSVAFLSAQQNPNAENQKERDLQGLKVPIENRAPIDSLFHNDLVMGLDFVANGYFSEALALFDSLEKVFPNQPGPNFYKAATYQNWMLSFRFNKFQDKLYENAKLAIDKGKILLESSTDPWINFYVGAAYGFKALHRFRQHNWIAAYFDSRDGVDNFNIALEKAPDLYDCYYGLGAYNYWRSAKSKLISFLIFWMADNRKLGLEQIQLSIDRGRYCPSEATYGLVMAYYHHGDFRKALELNKNVLKESDPPSLPSLYMLGRLNAKFEKWPEVQEIFEGILQRLEIQEYQSNSYQVECKYWIAKSLKKQGQPVKANKFVIQALKQSEKWVKEDELENPFEAFEIIEEWLEKLQIELEDEIAEKEITREQSF